MITNLTKTAAAATVALGALAFAESQAFAMPALDQTVVTATAAVQDVDRADWPYWRRWHHWHRWHCWRPYW
jgi:hypothetical protein